ncbi:MAG TPA: YdcF family protein [Kofleriaceae bacterium]|nr:YdcF family protein [Kofleriaceae bacterium]
MIGLVAKLLEAPLAVGDTSFEARDAIVVLGAPLTAAGELSQVLEERVAAAVALYRMGGGRLVVASGGPTHGTRPEAAAIAEALHAAGIPDVLVEDRSLSTAENARLTAEVLAPLGVRTVWIVTQPFHAKRAARLFRRAGLDARSWHIADSVQYRDRGRAVRWLVREYASWAALAVRGPR